LTFISVLGVSMSFRKESGPRGPGFGFILRGVLTYHLMRLESWNIAILARKSECCPNYQYQNAHVSYMVGGSPQPTIPSFHHSIIPVFLYSFISRTTLPYSSTKPPANGGMTIVEEYSTKIAGPWIRLPLCSLSLAKIFVRTRR